MRTAARAPRLRRAGLPACGLGFLLAVPGGCIHAPVHQGHLMIANRTEDVLVIRALHAEEEEYLVQPCETFERDGFPLDGVGVSPRSTGSGNAIEVGVENGELILLILPSGASRQVEAIPSPEPVCAGHM